MSAQELRPLRRELAARLALLCLGAALCTACGGRPFTDELAQLDQLLQARAAQEMRVDVGAIEDPNVRDLRERSITSLDAAYLNFDHAADAWKHRDNDVAREFSRVGLIHYAAADNYARSAEARVRLAEANRLHQQQRERRNVFDTQLRSETDLIALLETIIGLFEQNEALRREIATMESQYQTESRAVYAIQEARVLQREAEGVKAPEFAGTGYTTANASLTRAQAHFDEGDYERAYDVALRAMEEYRLAIEASRPNFLAEQDLLLANTQIQAIFEESQRRFGSELAFIDARGLVIVVPALFERSRSDMRDDRVYLLDEILDLARQYPNREILVEGHTQDRGSDDTNMALSQARADEVQDWFLQRNIRGSRISTGGFGEAVPRFDNRTEGGRADNDRVEIVFLVD